MPAGNSRGDDAERAHARRERVPPSWHGLSCTPDVWSRSCRGVIGGLEPANSGSHLAMSSSSPMAPRSTKVMKVAAVSHFVDDAIDSGVAPDMPPTACSWITAPSAATIRIMPPDSPADRTRCVEQRVGGVERARREGLARAATRSSVGLRRPGAVVEIGTERRRPSPGAVDRSTRRSPTTHSQRAAALGDQHDERDCPPRPTRRPPRRLEAERVSRAVGAG